MSLVTLTTDFGTADGYVGAMKGVILSLAPHAHVVDISHAIERHDIAGGAFALAQAAPHFPPGTIHVVVIDPGVGGARTPVVAAANRQFFIGPDNGVLSLAARKPERVHAIRAPGFLREEPSSTFHGRDIFAVCAGRLAAGAEVTEVGPSVDAVGRRTFDAGGIKPAGVTATVIHIDSFGNLITDCAGDALPAQARFRVGDRIIDGLSTTFESVDRGELVAYVGSGETLEIAVREGSAARVLGAARGTYIEILS